jgi:two-component system aerobic respiration control sensor histidine kinase ArcB
MDRMNQLFETNQNFSINHLCSFLLENTSDIVIILSSENKFIQYNKFAEIYFSLNKNEIIGKDCSWLITKINSNNNQFKNNLTIEWHITELLSTENVPCGCVILGKPNRAITIDEDVFDFNHVLDKIPGNFYWKNNNGMYLGCNRSFLQSIGFSTAEMLIGKHDQDLWLQDAKEHTKHDQLVLEKKSTQYFHETITLATKKINFVVMKMAIFNKKNQVIGIVGNSLPITELYSTQISLLFCKEKLEQENKTLEEIIASVPGSIYWKNTEGVYLGCNDFMVKTAGLTSKTDIIGHSDFELWPQHAKELFEHDKLVMRIGHSIRSEEQVVLPNGKKRYFTVEKIPLRDQANNISGIIGNSIEITELKNTQKALQIAKAAAEAANNAKIEFIANMSHDIRTPISGVVGMSQLLIDKLTDSEQKQYAQWLHESGEQLLELLTGILDVVSADRMYENALHEEFFDLRQCMMDIVELEHPTTHLKNLDLRVDIEPSVPKYIKSDRTKLHRILLNLLGNAIKFTDKGYVAIEAKLIRLQKQKATIRFSVVDTGIGIAKDQQSKVFDRFHRAVSSYKGVYAGHGVGLHIAQTYTALLGGVITLESTLGKGTRFSFELNFQATDKVIAEPGAPLLINQKVSSLPEQTAQVVEEKSASTAQTDSNIPKVLLVEDNLIARKVAEGVVTSTGCQVINAVDGEEALELAKTMSFNLIISDIGLPDISGYDFTQSVREWEQATHKPPVPIIGLTAHAESKAKDQAIAAGMNDIYSKPINLSLMQTILTTYVGTHKKEPRVQQGLDAIEPPRSLGPDLPALEEELFYLDEFPYLDIQLAKDNISDERLLRDILEMMMSEEITQDIHSLKQAHLNQDWETVEKLAHKIKGGAVYIGTEKMRYACQYLERYKKAGHTKLLEPLYQQLLSVVVNTQAHIKEWLSH